MPSFAVSLAFLLAAGQPPAEAPAVPATTAETPAPEPKMICKYEFATGSRVQKVKVCRPENQTSNDLDTKLQRDLTRLGDARIPAEGGLGN